MKLSDSKLKLYLDTTIPNYVFALDSPERMAITRQFMRLVDVRRHEMIISDVVMNELNSTAGPKKALLLEQVRHLPVLPLTPEAEHLARLYLQDGILRARSLNDARHIAIATLNRVDALVSWNFGDLVNLRKTKAVNVLHTRLNLPHIEIITPEEVLE